MPIKVLVVWLIAAVEWSILGGFAAASGSSDFGINDFLLSTEFSREEIIKLHKLPPDCVPYLTQRLGEAKTSDPEVDRVFKFLTWKVRQFGAELPADVRKDAILAINAKLDFTGLHAGSTILRRLDYSDMWRPYPGDPIEAAKRSPLEPLVIHSPDDPKQLTAPTIPQSVQAVGQQAPTAPPVGSESVHQPEWLLAAWGLAGFSLILLTYWSWRRRVR